MWVLNHLEDLESDFAVFHRVGDPLSLPGPEFFRKARRLSAYSGVMAARAMAEQERSRPSYARAPRGPGASSPPREVSLSELRATHPDLIEMG
jgi:hypothetical protein